MNQRGRPKQIYEAIVAGRVGSERESLSADQANDDRSRPGDKRRGVSRERVMQGPRNQNLSDRLDSGRCAANQRAVLVLGRYTT
jgi:hypothetical protein